MYRHVYVRPLFIGRYRLELADPFVSQIHIADNLMADPEQVADANIELIAARYPADRVQGGGEASKYRE